MRRNITILGDSRVFDTYYTNSRYTVRYGYDKTFPHVWRKAALTDPACPYDVVHIPDHFRGGTVQTNIIRLALTDPAIVVILDGIWETLLNKGHYLDYLERNPDAQESADDYSHERLAGLFKTGKLSVSPATYAEQQTRLISYFRRRARQVIWMTLPVPPKDYIGATYHAGDYRPIATWDECLTAVNDAIQPVVTAYGGQVLDLTFLMNEFGGPQTAFIDQWHFSEGFHARIAEALGEMSDRLLADALPVGHVSGNFMLANDAAPGSLPDEILLYEGDPAGELAALNALSAGQILLYPSELGEIDNPLGNDRAEFEKMASR